jgi:hypothetical protein
LASGELGHGQSAEKLAVILVVVILKQDHGQSVGELVVMTVVVLNELELLVWE